MPLNLNSLQQPANKPLIEPRDIFASLSKRPWPRLRVEQDQVLKTWFDRRQSERDLVIKQNTGGGKTVVGLLAAQSSLNEGVGPAAYLVPDTYLVDQVVSEADRLGIAVTTDAKDAEFESGRSILVCTFHKVVNGRTVFGLTNGLYTPRLIGTIVVDDAHAALAAARRQFTVEVPPNHPAFTKAVEMFGAELKRQSPTHGVALVEGQRCAPLRIPFWLWANQHQQVTSLIAASAEDNNVEGVFFSWRLLSDYLNEAVATISDRGLQLRTPCPPISLIPAFARAKRRIYLTATLADDGVLVTELAADAASIRRPITPERATDLGDRLIIAPAALNPELDGDAIRMLAHQFALGDRDGDSIPDADPVNVVVLVPSDAAALRWQGLANRVLHVADMKPAIAELTDHHVGLVVLVNKYDGVDLPGKACRLLVIDGVPTPLDAGEQREASALAGSEEMRIRKVQRIEQGMGRGIRDAEDYCAVLLVGDNVAQSLVDRTDLRHFSPATQAQIGLSQQLAGQIVGEGLMPVRQALSVFLDRDPAWKQASSQATAGVEYDRNGHVPAVAEARRKAWDLAAAGDPGAAANTLYAALTALDPIERGWRLEEVAAYRQFVDPPKAQQELRAAKQANSTVVLPTMPLPSRPVVGLRLQAEAAAKYLADHYDNATSMQLAVSSMLDALEFSADPDLVEPAETAMRDLGEHIGLVSTRPEKEQSKGPDICWGLTPTKNAVIELKTNVTRPDNRIIKSEINQLAGDLSWNSEVGGPTDCVPVMVAHQAALYPEAAAPSGTRVITPQTLTTLKQHVRAFATMLASHDRWRDPAAVQEALVANNLTTDQIIQRHSVGL